MGESCVYVGVAARFLGVSGERVRQLIDDEGKLEAFRLGPKGWRKVTVKSLAGFLNKPVKEVERSLGRFR